MTAELRTDVTKTRKDGTSGRLRYDYGEQRDPQAAIAWLWKFLDAAKTAGELYGRGLVVIAAEQYATRLVVPVVTGGSGGDTLRGGPGRDTLRGGLDTDRLNGGRSRDVCRGGPAVDSATRCEIRLGIP